MSWPFGKHPSSRRFWSRRKRVFARPKNVQFIDPKGRRLIGMTKETYRPIFAPKGHSLLLSSNGGGKSTCGGMISLFSLLSSDPNRAIAVFDSKDGGAHDDVVLADRSVVCSVWGSRKSNLAIQARAYGQAVDLSPNLSLAELESNIQRRLVFETLDSQEKVNRYFTGGLGVNQGAKGYVRRFLPSGGY